MTYSIGESGWVCSGVTFNGVPTANESIFTAGSGNATEKGVWLLRPGSAIGEDYIRLTASDGVSLYTSVAMMPKLRNTPRVIDGGWTPTSLTVAIDGNEVTTVKSGNVTPQGRPSSIGCYVQGFHHLIGPMSVIVLLPVLPSQKERDLIRKYVASTNRAVYWSETPTLDLNFVADSYKVSNGEV